MTNDLATRFDFGGDYPESLYRNDVRATCVPNLSAVDDAAVAEYRTLGFVAVEHALTQDEVRISLDGLRTLIDDAPEGIDLQFEGWALGELEGMDSSTRADSVRKMMRFLQESERLRRIAYHPQIIRIVQSIIGTDDVIVYQDMALLKPPGGGREKPWHQDKAFFNLDLDATLVGVWIALDEATPQNGCMHVVPGSHRDGPVAHFARRDFQICDSEMAGANDVVVPLPAGGLMVFDGYIHHGTPANRTNTRRRALQFHYAARDALTIPEDARLAAFGSDGRNVEC